jgi:hypothetical protein
MNNLYQDKLEDYIKTIKIDMYTFEITKCCGYSSFVTMYKNESLLNLYEKVGYHFAIDIKELFFYTMEGQRIRVPLSNKKVIDFLLEYTVSKKLIPLYPPPLPKVYKLYIEYDHYNNCTNCSMDL